LLVGMMGAGKSVVGAAVASRLGWAHLDSDQLVEQRTGTTVAGLFSEQGEAAFRAEEAAALAEAIGGPAQGPAVVSVAGGAVLSPGNRRLLHDAGLVIWLRASLPTLARRVDRGDHRPLLAGDRMGQLTELYEARRPCYEELADVVIDVDDLTVAEVVNQVVATVPVGCGGRGA
jgi:shikimate kinase